jgi:hypothetical protein
MSVDHASLIVIEILALMGVFVRRGVLSLRCHDLVNVCVLFGTWNLVLSLEVEAEVWVVLVTFYSKVI